MNHLVVRSVVHSVVHFMVEVVDSNDLSMYVCACCLDRQNCPQFCICAPQCDHLAVHPFDGLVTFREVKAVQQSSYGNDKESSRAVPGP